jgi:GntR family transcriptional regulator
MINKNSPLPIYYQLEQMIKEWIEKKKIQPGESIPSERELAEQFDISRMTVRQAINNLVNDGYLVRKRGKGTFVAEQKIEQVLKGLTSFSEDMRVRGMEPGTKLLKFSVIKASSSLAQQLNIPELDEVYEIQRIRLADHIPMALETCYLPCSRVPQLTKEVVKGSLYEWIEQKAGLIIHTGVQELEASVARKVEADLLEIKEGAPVLFIQRKSLLENGKPLEIVKSVYRGDRYKFIVEMNRL